MKLSVQSAIQHHTETDGHGTYTSCGIGQKKASIDAPSATMVTTSEHQNGLIKL